MKYFSKCFSPVKIQEAGTSCFCFSDEKHFCLVAAQQVGSAISSQEDGSLEGNWHDTATQQRIGM